MFRKRELDTRPRPLVPGHRDALGRALWREPWSCDPMATRRTEGGARRTDWIVVLAIVTSAAVFPFLSAAVGILPTLGAYLLIGGCTGFCVMHGLSFWRGLALFCGSCAAVVLGVVLMGKEPW